MANLEKVIPYRTFRDLNHYSEIGDETFIEYEGSTITIPIKLSDKKKGIEFEERLKLKAYMRLEVFPAYLSELGKREFQFIIRDWELFGESLMFNKAFSGDIHGERTKKDSCERNKAIITFSVAHCYLKKDDFNNESLADVYKKLKIVGLTRHNHDSHNGNLYWTIENDQKNTGCLTIKFIKEEGSNNPDDVVCSADNLSAGDNFVAAPPPQRFTVNLGKDYNEKYELTVKWRLGSNPKAGEKGTIHIVDPSKSLCIANQGPSIGQPVESADFPARIIYAANYNVYVNSLMLIEDRAGIAIADGVVEIPPRDVKVAFQKPYRSKNPIANHTIDFDSGTCTGMRPISREEFEEGRAIVEKARDLPFIKPAIE